MKRLSFLLLAILLIGCGGGGGGGGESSGSGSTPIVTTLVATSITPNSALLSGTVIPNGLQTQSWFEYGTDSSLTTYTSSAKQDAGSGLTGQAASLTWDGLAAGTTYYFRFCAENSKGYSKDLIVRFTTSSPGSHKITDWPDNKKGAVSLTFDDGSDSQLSLGIPALDKRGLKGTFFLITNFVTAWNSWKNAANSGHEIGSHTMTHPHLTTLSLSQVQNEMLGAKAAIEAQIRSETCLFFAYPYGELNNSVKSIAQNIYVASRGGNNCGLNSEPIDFSNVRGCSPDDGNDIYGQTNAAEQQGKWLVAIFHSLNSGKDGYGSWSFDTWTTYLDYLKNKNLWVGSFGAAVKYIQERMSATLSVLSVSSSQIVLSLTDGLDDAIYDQPLTIRSEVPSGWDNVMVQQGSSITEVQSRVEGATRVIIYIAVPDRGLITLRSLRNG